MRKILNTKLFYFFLGAIIFSSASVFAYSLMANNIGYNPKDPSWNVDNTESAINDLHNTCSYCKKSLIGKTWDYEYTNNEQDFTVSYTGTYKLEVWGAQGGNTTGYYNYSGGFGSYSIGEIRLNKGNKLYIYVGGQGKSVASGCVVTLNGNNYNGGGNISCQGSALYSGGGGGATHIATTSRGELKQYKDNINEILIVAGGGGAGAGANYSQSDVFGTGGAGGGFKGASGTNTGSRTVGGGGTQTSGGTSSTDGNSSFSIVSGFGQGCSPASSYGSYMKSAGGGGFYGGGCGTHAGGGGGSGYIGNSLLTNKKMVMYSTNNSFISNEDGTKTEITPNSNVEAKSNFPKKGNGYARITLISLE